MNCATAGSRTCACMPGTTVRATPRATAAGALLLLCCSGLRRERRGDDALQPFADRALGQPCVDAGLARLGAAGAEACRGRQPEDLADGRQQRAARVALAGVGAALRVAGAHHGLGVERTVV